VSQVVRSGGGSIYGAPYHAVVFLREDCGCTIEYVLTLSGVRLYP
jgi:hypothetical protein